MTDLKDCECVPGHRCDCEDLRSLLYRILTSAEYPKMEAEGLAAKGLGLVWSESQDRYVINEAESRLSHERSADAVHSEEWWEAYAQGRREANMEWLRTTTPAEQERYRALSVPAPTDDVLAAEYERGWNAANAIAARSVPAPTLPALVSAAEAVLAAVAAKPVGSHGATLACPLWADSPVISALEEALRDAVLAALSRLGERE